MTDSKFNAKEGPVNIFRQPCCMFKIFFVAHSNVLWCSLIV